MKTAHIICKNDSTQAVCLGTVEQTKKIKNRMEQEAFGRDKYNVRPPTIEQYRVHAYWHVHEDVPVLEE